MTFAVHVEVRLRAGIADPQGATIERSLPALGLRRRQRRPGRQVHPLRRRGRRRGRRPGRGRRHVRAVPHQPGDRGRGDRHRGRRSEHGLMAPRVGVVALPRLELRARRHRGGRRRSAARPTSLWHGDDTRRRRRRRRRARRLRPRRLPAARRHRPVLAGHGRRSPSSRPTGGPVVGICNGFQVLTEAGLAAGRAAEEPRASSSCADRRAAGRVDRLGAHVGRRRSAHVLRIPINHFEGNYTCSRRDARRAARRRPGRVPLCRQPEWLDGRHRRHLQRRPQRGRPHAASRAGQSRRCSARPTGVRCCGRCWRSALVPPSERRSASVGR